jgi:hypothetical protein
LYEFLTSPRRFKRRLSHSLWLDHLNI